VASTAYARSYAQAAFEIALEQDGLDKWQADLDKMSGLALDTDILAWLENPKTPIETKTRLLGEVLGDVEPLARNLLFLLLARGRSGLMAEIVTEYRRQLDSYRGIEPAEVVTAVPLDEDTKRQLAENLGAITGKKVVVTAEVDPALLGGFIARVGGKLLDGSTRNRLQALKTKITRG
jgi:F-type H+-transporting ATPase subunit delta